MSNIEKVIHGHDSFETAFVIEDYPYGRLRTQKKVWLESNKNGTRCVSCTKNPKTGRWNKPKMSTYSCAGVMYIEKETGYVQWTAINDYSQPEKTKKFVELAGGFDKLTSFEQNKVKNLLGDFAAEMIPDEWTGDLVEKKQHRIKWNSNKLLELRFSTTGGITLDKIYKALAEIKDRKRVLHALKEGSVTVYAAKGAYLGRAGESGFLEYLSMDDNQ